MTNMDRLRRTARLQNAIFDQAATWPSDQRADFAAELRRLANLIAEPEEEPTTLFGFARLSEGRR